MLASIRRVKPPDIPIRIQVIDLHIHSALISDIVAIDALWQDIDNPILTFWTRNLDFLPDVNRIYEWSKDMTPRLLT